MIPVLRPSRILAIARQDLAHEFKGRQGLLLPAVIAGLMLPASVVPSPMSQVADTFEDERVWVTGDVPDAVRTAEAVAPRGQARFRLRFHQDGPVLRV
ncbi:MAG: hypothetical protein ABMB14_30960, partial [Myxococcota bacterium]